MNVTALGATAPTFLTVWPDGTRPKASSLNPAPGQPPTPNAVTTTLSGVGSFQMFNRAGSVDVIVDINGFYTKASLQELTSRIAALEAGAGADPTIFNRITALEAENAALKELTASMSLETVDGKNTIRFSGVNVQVVDGSGDTAGTVNGTGNLIVGYNENDSDVRTGSHNLIVGPEHSYSNYGGLLAGFNNAAGGASASVSGGSGNTADDSFASISGGQGNTASGNSASVSGGFLNTASSIYASVSGGRNNTASGQMASVSGGRENTANGSSASVSGGRENAADGANASVSGGLANTVTAIGTNGPVSGGGHNTASDEGASVSGGTSNTASGSFASVSGGEDRSVAGAVDWRAGLPFQGD